MLATYVDFDSALINVRYSHIQVSGFAVRRTRAAGFTALIDYQTSSSLRLGLCYTAITLIRFPLATAAPSGRRHFVLEVIVSNTSSLLNAGVTPAYMLAGCFANPSARSPAARLFVLVA